MDDLTRVAIGELAERVEKLETNQAEILTMIERLSSAGAKMAKASIELTDLVKDHVAGAI